MSRTVSSVRVAGHVIVRQRSRDGQGHAVPHPRRRNRHLQRGVVRPECLPSAPAVAAYRALLRVEGPLQSVDGVSISARARSSRSSRSPARRRRHMTFTDPRLHEASHERLSRHRQRDGERRPSRARSSTRRSCRARSTSRIRRSRRRSRSRATPDPFETIPDEDRAGMTGGARHAQARSRPRAPRGAPQSRTNTRCSSGGSGIPTDGNHGGGSSSAGSAHAASVTTILTAST